MTPSALDLALTLRPEDLDDDERAAIDALPDRLRADAEEDDAAFAALLGAWIEAPLPEPSLRAVDVLARAATPRLAAASVRWMAVAAALLVSLGAWQLGQRASVSSPDASTLRPKSLVADQVAARVALQFSVEDGRGGVAPGRNGATYGVGQSLIFRFELSGEPGYVSLVEVSPSGAWTALHPADGPGALLSLGSHLLEGDSGAALSYRPDAADAGTLTYVALVTSEPVEPSRLLPGLLAAGLHRADLWPRPVLALDAVTVTWSDR